MSNCNAAFLINNDNIWSEGCGHKLTAKILDKKDILGIVALAIVGVQVRENGRKREQVWSTNAASSSRFYGPTD